MKKLLTKSGICLLFIILAMCAVVNASDKRVRAAASGRISVATDRDAYSVYNVMRISVEVYNNGEIPIRIRPIGKPVKIDPIDANDLDTVFVADLEDGPADVVIELPNKKRIIGYARLTPLRRYRNSDVQQEFLPRKKSIVLPLLGSGFVLPHSTRIISNAYVLLRPLRQLSDPNVLEAEWENIPADVNTPPEPVEAVATYPVAPGDYLLSCTVVNMAGNRRAVAQKIIRILRPKIRPVPVNVN